MATSGKPKPYQAPKPSKVRPHGPKNPKVNSGGMKNKIGGASQMVAGGKKQPAGTRKLMPMPGNRMGKTK